MTIGLSREQVTELVEADGEVGLAEFMNTLSEMDQRHAGRASEFVAAHMAVYVSGNELLETLAALYATYGGGEQG